MRNSAEPRPCRCDSVFPERAALTDCHSPEEVCSFYQAYGLPVQLFGGHLSLAPGEGVGLASMPRRHLHLDYGPLHADYQGPADQVADVAHDLAASGELTVWVDDQVCPDHAPLPCARLWDSGIHIAPRRSDSRLSQPISSNSHLIEQGIGMPSSIIGPDAAHQVVNLDDYETADHDDPLDECSWVYRHRFGWRTIYSADEARITMRANNVAAFMVPCALASGVRQALGAECGPVFSDDYQTWIFLAQPPCTAIDIAEATPELYRRYHVLAMAHSDLVVDLPTPGNPRRCWIQPPFDRRLPEFDTVVAALAGAQRSQTDR